MTAAFDYRAARAEVFGSSLPGPLKLLALALIEFMPDAWPSVATLAGHCGVNRKTVLRAIERLERLGVLAVERATGRPSRYVLRPREEWRTGPILSPVPDIGTGPKSSPVPTEDVAGPILSPPPVPNRPSTGPILTPEAGEADQTSGGKRSARDGGPKSSPVTVTGHFASPLAFGAPPFAAPVLAQRYEQYPPGWSWSEETRAAAVMAGVTPADLREHVDFWTTHAWSAPVTDLDAELRRRIPDIKRRRDTERAKASKASQAGGFRGAPVEPPVPEPKRKHRNYAEHYGLDLAAAAERVAATRVHVNGGEPSFYRALERELLAERERRAGA